MSGTVGIESTREFAGGRFARVVRRGLASTVGYLRAVRTRGGLPVAHGVPVAVAITFVLTWVLVAVASAARPV